MDLSKLWDEVPLPMLYAWMAGTAILWGSVMLLVKRNSTSEDAMTSLNATPTEQKDTQ